MITIRKTDNTLIIREVLYFSYILGFAFLMVGLVGLINPDYYVERVPFWFAALFVISGIAVILLTKATVYVFNLATRSLIITKHAIRGKETVKIPFSSIVKVELQEYIRRSGFVSHRYHRVFLLTRDGKRIIIGSVSRGLLKPLIDRDKAVGKTVSNFIGVPLIEKQSPTTQELISSVEEQVRTEIKKAKKQQSESDKT